MPKYLDFEAIKADNRIEDVAKRLGLKLKKQGNQLRGTCPSGKGGERALAITPGKQRFYSFGAERGGDVIELVAFIQDIPVKEAAQWLQGDTAPEERADKPRREAGDARGGFSRLDYLQHEHEAVEALDLDPDVAQALGVGYAPRGVLRGTVAIPLRNDDGSIAGYIGVTCIDKLPPKWHLT